MAAVPNFVLDAALEAAQAATTVLLGYAVKLSTAKIRSKSNPVDLVSSADEEAQEAIRAVLMRALPDSRFIGEEGEGASAPTADWIWLVDPLDGTSNFLSGLPLWSISIALTDPAYRPLAGVIAAPPLGKTWHAVRGGGCFVNGTACRVRAEPPGGGLHNSMLATGFPYSVASGEDINIAYFAHMQRVFHKIRRLGSAAIDLAFIAEGLVDGMWELQLQPWDTAAGILLVEEAGGQVCRFDGSAYQPGDYDLLAAATPGLLQALRAELATAGQHAPR